MAQAGAGWSRSRSIHDKARSQGNDFRDWWGEGLTVPASRVPSDKGRDFIAGGPGVDKGEFYFRNSPVSVDLRRGTARGPVLGRNRVASIENVIASCYPCTLLGDDGRNEILGYPFSKRPLPGARESVIRGRGSDDYLRNFGGKPYHLFGGAGNDFLDGLGGADALSGGRGGDKLYGGAWHDTLLGGAGRDKFFDDPGDDSTSGGPGEDLVFLYSDTGVVVNLATGSATGRGSDTFSGIKNLRGTPFADTLIGNNDSNRLSGLGGDDDVRGRKSDDFLLGGEGSDRLDGGQGTDFCGEGEEIVECEQ